jgi:pimeloyl-ACP methyl ester carboxylesterase
MSAERLREPHAITLSGGRLLGYAEYGDPHGFPVLAFHGWPGSRLQGARYDAAARRSGVRLIAPDRPGVGLSDSQPGRTLRDWPRDVAALADQLELERFAVLGVSGGGPYALACARWIPERLHAVGVASGLGLLLSADVTTAQSRWLLRALLAGRIMPRIGLRLVAEALRRRPHTALHWGSKPMPACDRVIVSEPAFRSIAIADLNAALRDGGSAAAHDLALLTGDWGFDLAEVQAPILLWHGEQDGIVPCALGRHVAASLPHCRATFFPDEGHYVVVPRAEEILRAMMMASDPRAR